MFTSSQYELFLASNFATSFSLSSNGSIGVFVSDCVKWDKHLSRLSFFLEKIFHRGGPWSPAPACILFPGAMPKGDTWPGGVAAEPSSNMDSAGSYDSVISTNSGYVSSDPLPSVPLTLLLYSWPYKTQTADAHRRAQWAVTAYWTHWLKCGSILKRHF